MLYQLNTPLPVHTPKGKAFCHYIIDYSMDNHLMFVCFLDESGECWTFSNPEIRIQNNPTIGRNVPCKAALHAGLPSQPHQSQVPSPQSESLPQPVLYSEELRRKIAEKFPTPAFE
jgi:hypothetical protein